MCNHERLCQEMSKGMCQKTQRGNQLQASLGAELKLPLSSWAQQVLGSQCIALSCLQKHAGTGCTLLVTVGQRSLT